MASRLRWPPEDVVKFGGSTSPGVNYIGDAAPPRRRSTRDGPAATTRGRNAQEVSVVIAGTIPPEPLPAWLESALGHTPATPALFARALTHSSHGEADYERLEFLGDRVLGLVAAAWLYRLLPDEPEGKLSRRINALVSRETCAEVAREIGIGRRIRLGKQARDDGAGDSDNVLGDVLEALIGALFLEGGLAAAERFIHRAWGSRVDAADRAPQHPKSALQEYAAANGRKPPVYALAGRAGPHHNPRFTVTVAVPGAGEASAEGSTKQEAETAAAAKLLRMLK